MKKNLEDLCERVSSDLDEKAKTYEELVTFANYYEYEPPKYYSKYVSNFINGDLIPDLDERIRDNLSHLYDEAILRVSDFVTNISGKKEIIDIELDNKTEKFNEGIIQTNFEKYNKEIETKQSKIKKMEQMVKERNDQANCIESEMESERQNANRDRQQYEKDKIRIGNDPGAKTKKVQKTRTVARQGIWVVIDWIWGERTETYYVTENDYSAQNEWKRRKAALEEKNRRVQDSHNRRINELDRKKSEIQDEIKTKSRAINRLREDVSQIESMARREKEIYEMTLKANKQEFCDNEKRKLKEEIYRVILEPSDDNSALNKMKKYINEKDLRNLPKVNKMVFKYFDDSLYARIESLNEIIEGNEKDLDTKYNLSKKELSVLNAVLAEI